MSAQNGTKLYDAVDAAIDRLQKAALPNDLEKVAIVTFTDGLDQGSYNANYTSNEEYLNAINSKIKNVKVKGLDINAHSIGIRGGDITDVNQFILNLNKIASTPGNVTEVTNMNDVYSKFSEIASDLYSESQSQVISLSIPQKYGGTKIRFTFDRVTNAANSNIYIEGTWSGNSLTSIVYQGLRGGSETTVAGTPATIPNYLTFSFANLTTTSGGNVPTDNIQQWEFTGSSSQWQINSEFGGSNNIKIDVTKKSAVIMLVLDCSSSLGNQFGNMQNSAKNFINILCSSSAGETFRLPSVSTSAASNIASTSATLNGNITDVGFPEYTQKGICYASTQNPTISNSTLMASGSGTGSYQVNATGLSTNQTYYARAYATNSQGTAYGNQITFTTKTAVPAQVRFQKTKAYIYVSHLGVMIDIEEDILLASYEFGSNDGISPYYSITPGNHYPVYYLTGHPSAINSWYYLASSSTYNFQTGYKYTLVCSDDGNGNIILNVVNDGKVSGVKSPDVVPIKIPKGEIHIQKEKIRAEISR
jgi:hypothetical protein